MPSMLFFILAQGIQLKPVEPPKGVEPPRLEKRFSPKRALEKAKDSIEVREEVGIFSHTSTFTSEELNSLLDSLRALSFQPFYPAEKVGSIDWMAEKDLMGYEVIIYTFPNVREVMETTTIDGERVVIESDPATVTVILLEKDGELKEYYIVKEYHLTSKDGSRRKSIIVEGYRKKE